MRARDRQSTSRGSALTSAAEAQAQARIQNRMAMLNEQMPVFGKSQPSAIYAMASSQMDDEQMMTAAIDAMQGAGINQQVEWLNTLDRAQQVSRAKTMNPNLLSALQTAGWDIDPTEGADGGGGFFSHGVGGFLAGALGGTMKVASKITTLPVIEHGLRAMDWIGEENTRLQRVTPIMASGRRVLDETGESEEELMARTGIDAHAASDSMVGGPNLPGPLRAMMGGFYGGQDNPLHFITNPQDMWKAVQTWNEIGHEGSDDFLPEVQLEVFNAFHAQDPDQAKNLLRWAKALAAGETLLEIAESEGLAGAEAQAFADKVGVFSTSELFRQQQARLVSGLVSPGRTFARAVISNPDADVSSGVPRLLSGVFDAGFQIAADPTMVAGKVAKGAKVYKWTVKTGQEYLQLHRWEHGVKMIDDALDIADDLERDKLIAERLVNMPSRSGKVKDTWVARRSLEQEFQAIHRPIKAITRAFETGDFSKLANEFPTLGAGAGDMRSYDAILKAQHAKGLHEIEGMHTIEGVFDFLKYALDAGSEARTVDPNLALKVMPGKLFGHDGLGHLTVPHMTNTQRWINTQRMGVLKWGDEDVKYERNEDGILVAADEPADLEPELQEALAVADQKAEGGEDYLASLGRDAADADQEWSEVQLEMGTGTDFDSNDMRAIKEAYDARMVERTESEAAIEAEMALLRERALSEEPGVAAQAQQRLAELEADDELTGILKGADAKEIHPQTGTWVKRRGEDVQKRVNTFLRWATTPVNRKGYVLLTDTPEGLREAKSFIDNVALVMQLPRTSADRMFNMWSNGTMAERHALVNKLTYNMASVTGFKDNEVAEEIFRKFVKRQNKIYGFTDEMRTDVALGEGKAAIDYLTHNAVMSKQLADAMAVPSMKQMIIATKKLNRMRRVAGTVRASWVESFMTRVWKPAVLFRLGFPLRAGADEMLQFTGRVGASAYMREAILKPWAGARELDGSLARDRFGKVISSPQPAFAPVRRFLDNWATIFGVTDDELTKRATEAAQLSDEWRFATEIERDAILSKAKREVKDQLHLPGKTLAVLNTAATELTVMASKEFAKLAGDRKWMSRAEWARWLLERNGQWADHVQSTRHMLRHAYAQHGLAEVMGGSYTQDALDESDVIGASIEARWDPTSPSKMRNVKVKVAPGEWTLYGNDQLSHKFTALNHRIVSMMSSPEAKAGAEAYSHHVPRATIDDVIDKAVQVDPEKPVDGVTAFKQAHDVYQGREPLAPDGLDYDDQKAVNDWLQGHADWSEASEILRSKWMGEGETVDIPYLFKALDINKKQGREKETLQQFATPELRKLVKDWNDFTPTTRTLLADPKFGYVELDLAKAHDRAVNNIESAMWRLENTDNLRKMVAASTVDGKMPIEKAPPGHARIMVPSMDRRGAQDLHDLLRTTDEEAVKGFQQILIKHLRRNGVGRYYKDVWDAMAPAQGWDITSWMATAKSNLITSDINYIPAGVVGTSNPNIAMALRDSIEEFFPEHTLKPTIGYMDQPDDLIRDPYGFVPIGDSVVNISPDHMAAVKHLDRDSMVKMVHIEKPDGRFEIIPEEQLERLFGTENMIQRVKAKRTARSLPGGKMMKAARDGYNHSIYVNYDAVNSDFVQGRAFFKGKGGKTWRRGSSYEYVTTTKRSRKLKSGKVSTKETVNDFTELAELVGDRLDDFGLADDTGKDLDMLIGEYKRRNMDKQPITWEEVMKDQPSVSEPKNPKKSLWDDFTYVAGRAKSKGSRPTVELDFDQFTADQSKIAKRALDELGITDADIDALTEDEYRELLMNRERLHTVLQTSGKGRAVTATPEGLEQEMDALANAWIHTGLEPTETMQARISLGQKDDGNQPYRVIGQYYASGATEQAAVRRAAMNLADEVRAVFISGKTGEVNHNVLIPALRGNHQMDNLWLRGVNLEDLPDRVPGKVELTAEETHLTKVLNRFFNGVVEPTIGAISRHPMYADSFNKAMKRWRHVYDNMVHKGLDAEAKVILEKVGIPEKTLRDVNEFIMTEVRSDKYWGEADDFYAEYAKAMVHGDWKQAAPGLDEAGVLLPPETPPGMNEARAWLARIHMEDHANSDWWEALEAVSDNYYKTRDLLLQYADDQMLLSDEEMLAMRNWHLNQADAVERWVSTAADQAVNMVTPFVDDHRVRSALQEYLGPVFLPFFYAEEQFLRRVTRGVIETPHMIRKGQLTMNGLRNLGFVRQDEQTGKEILVIPGTELFTGMAAQMATALTGNPAFMVAANPLSMRTDFVLPGYSTEQSRLGFGPLIGMATEMATQRFPELEWRKNDPNRRPWEYLVPGGVASAYRMQADDPQSLITGELAALSYMYVNHPLSDNASPEEIEDMLEDARQGARLISFMRFATGQVAFGSMGPIDPGAEKRNEWNDLIASGLSHEEAFEVFMQKENNPHAAIYTIYGTQNEVGAPLPATAGALEFLQENQGLIEQNPTAMAWLIPQDQARDDFDRRAYNEQLSLGLRSMRAPKELIEAARIKQASPDYWNQVDEYKAQRKNLQDRINAKTGNRQMLQEEMKALDEGHKAWKDSYLLMHPALAASFGPENSLRRKETISQLTYLTDAEVGGDYGKKVKDLIDIYNRFEHDYSGYVGQSSIVSKQIKQGLLDQYYDEMQLYVLANPETKAFFTSVLRPELPDVDPEKDKLTGG
jgi:hypothetical protein